MQEKLINWYNLNKRDLPWRKHDDPYAIWISEIMLQQTTTEAVIPYYNRFMKQFPTVHDLAKASLEDIYKQWEGLGYYRRAKHIHETAHIIVEKFHGIFPTRYQDILSLKGVGPYTAGAICSIAYHQEKPAIDGNVLRIIARTHLIQDNIALPQTQKCITNIVQELLKGYDASAFNQGLMDLGATICRPLHPQCDQCPIAPHCQAYASHQQNVLPINIKNIKRKELNYITGIITYNDSYMLIQNKQGLLENLYGCIQYACESPYSFVEEFEKEYGYTLTIDSYIKDIKHIFTHRTWHMHVYHFILDKPIKYLYTHDELLKLPISTAHLKVLQTYLKDIQ